MSTISSQQSIRLRFSPHSTLIQTTTLSIPFPPGLTCDPWTRAGSNPPPPAPLSFTKSNGSSPSLANGWSICFSWPNCSRSCCCCSSLSSCSLSLAEANDEYGSRLSSGRISHSWSSRYQLAVGIGTAGGSWACCWSCCWCWTIASWCVIGHVSSVCGLGPIRASLQRLR